MDLCLFITALACLAALEFAGGGDTVTPFCLPGRLRNRPDNPHQFACDSGDRYIRTGDTEPETKYPLGPPRSSNRTGPSRLRTPTGEAPWKRLRERRNRRWPTRRWS